MRNKIYTLLLFLLSVGLFSCQKTENIQPEPSFDAQIGKNKFLLHTDKITVSKGITILVGSEVDNTSRSTMIITVRGVNEGVYKQEYDYKTRVSVAQCGMTYKIMTKSASDSPQFFISYEGSVTISDIDRDKNSITGSYSFRIKSIPEAGKIEEIKGEFVNVSFN